MTWALMKYSALKLMQKVRNNIMADTKLVTIASVGSLPELGGISGPVINPCSLPIETIVKLLNGHKKVYEVNPAKKSERVLLTLKNVKSVNFVTRKPAAKANVAPAQKVEAKKEAPKVVSTTNTSAPKTEDKKADAKAEAPKSDFTKK